MKKGKMFLLSVTKDGWWSSELSDVGRKQLDDPEYEPRVEFWEDWDHYDSADALLDALKSDLLA